MKKGGDKPKCGLYAIRIIATLFSVIEIIGLLLLLAGYAFNAIYPPIGGGIITAFGIYMVVAHFLSLYIFTDVDSTRFSLIAKLLELNGDEYVLDVGCGTGRTAIRWRKG